MVCIYGTKRRRTKATRDTTIIPFADASETVVIVDDDEPTVHIEILPPLCYEQATSPGSCRPICRPFICRECVA
jgi:hypothetical protein